jgi:hypothetical protein
VLAYAQQRGLACVDCADDVQKCAVGHGWVAATVARLGLKSESSGLQMMRGPTSVAEELVNPVRQHKMVACVCVTHVHAGTECHEDA